MLGQALARYWAVNGCPVLSTIWVEKIHAFGMFGEPGNRLSAEPFILPKPLIVEGLSGMTCFSLAGVDPGKDAVASEVHVLYDSACTSAATIDRLGTAPAEALTGAPAEDAKQQPAPVTT